MRQWMALIIGMVAVFAVRAAVLNAPHAPSSYRALHGAFSSAPKTLDPARAYSSNEIQIIAQIYEPPLQYDYFSRPYQLIPLTAQRQPVIVHKNGVTWYTISIRPHIYYQPHPAFARDPQLKLYYAHLTQEQAQQYHHLSDFKHQGTRELTAADYVYEIKRLADPRLNSPIFGLMSKYIIGLKAYRHTLSEMLQARGLDHRNDFLDLRHIPLAGVEVIDRYHYRIKIHGRYPPFKYWLAMTFFSPVPWEVDRFYSDPWLDKQHINFDWQCVGTGPYMLTENDPNQEMILEANPNFRKETFPSNGSVDDQKAGYTINQGKRLPLTPMVMLSLEKESIPRWNKFLQGYYDRSGIGVDSFDQAIAFDRQGRATLTKMMKQKGIMLSQSVSPSIFYFGFNMLDDVVGGLDEKHRKLRQAIAIALDQEEYIHIFLNGRGVASQGPLPPGMVGYSSDYNPYVYEKVDGQVRRKSIQDARALLKQAGYPNGIDPKTRQPLMLNYDVAGSQGPDDRARFDWMRKRFARLGIDLNVRSTLYNRFQEKMRQGQAQIFSWGWNADYPDAENFLFLLYGPNGKAHHGGENAANYNNPKFNEIFDQIKKMEPGSRRFELIQKAVNQVRFDAPWVFGLHPINFSLSHQWVSPIKVNPMANNTLKYVYVDASKRGALQKKWNAPYYVVLVILLGAFLLLAIGVVWFYWRRQAQPRVRRNDF